MSLLFDCHVTMLPIDLWPYGIGPVAAWSATFGLMASGLWLRGLRPLPLCFGLTPYDLWPYGVWPVVAWSAACALMIRADCRMTCGLMASGLWLRGLRPLPLCFGLTAV